MPALRRLRHRWPTAIVDVLTTPVGAHALRLQPELYNDLLVFSKHTFDRPTSLMQPANLRIAARLRWRLHAGRYGTVLLLHHLTTRFGALKYRLVVAATGARNVYGLDNGRGAFLTHAIRDEGFGVQHEAAYWLAVVDALGNEPGALIGDVVPGTGLFDVQNEQQKPDTSMSQLILLHPGSGAFAPARRWPPANWATVADALLSAGYTVALVGGAEEAPLREAVRAHMQHADALQDMGGNTSIAELAHVMQNARLFLGGDSGLVHLAAAVGTPVVAPYGPTDPHAWGPWSGAAWQHIASLEGGVAVLAAGPHRVLHAPIACSPCIYRDHSLGTPHGCPDRTCLTRITAEHLLMVINDLLAPPLVPHAA